MARVLRDIGRFATLIAVGLVLEVRLQAEDPGATDRVPVLLAQKAVQKKKKGATKPATPTPAAETKAPEMPAAATGGTALKFSRDIAPILVGNCIGCHNPERRRGKFDLTTFEKLMAGSDVEKVIVPGKPDESHLVLRLRGEETPKMPQGNNNNLSDEAIARIESWVKAGALLDAGIDRKATLPVVCPHARTTADRRAEENAGRRARQDGRDRRAQALEAGQPQDHARGDPGHPFPPLQHAPQGPRDRRPSRGWTRLTRSFARILSKPGATQPALDWAKKPSLFVFNDPNSFVEFVRTQENREIEPTERGTANFGDEGALRRRGRSPGGREESGGVGGAGKASRSARSEDDSGGSERSVAGLLAEHLAVGVLKNEKNAPNWLCLGLGGYFAAALDPRSTYVQKLRGAAVGQLASRAGPRRPTMRWGESSRPTTPARSVTPSSTG